MTFIIGGKPNLNGTLYFNIMWRFPSFISKHFSLKHWQLVLVWETHGGTLTLTKKDARALLRTTFKNHQKSERKWRECQLEPSGGCCRLQRQHCSDGPEAFSGWGKMFLFHWSVVFGRSSVQRHSIVWLAKGQVLLFTLITSVMLLLTAFQLKYYYFKSQLCTVTCLFSIFMHGYYK